MQIHSSTLAWKIPWTEEPGATSFVAQMVKNLIANAGDPEDLGSIPWLGISSGGGNGN